MWTTTDTHDVAPGLWETVSMLTRRSLMTALDNLFCGSLRVLTCGRGLA